MPTSSRTCGNAVSKISPSTATRQRLRPGALDDLDAAVLGGRPVALAERHRQGLLVQRVVVDGVGGDGVPVARRRPDPALLADSGPRRTGRAGRSSRRRPASGSRRRPGRRPGRSSRAAGGRSCPRGGASGAPSCPAASGVSHNGGWPAPVVGPNRDAAVGWSRSAMSLATAAAPNAAPDSPVATTAIADAGQHPPAPDRRPALQPPGDPEAAEQAGREQRDQPRIDGLDRRQERLRAEGRQLRDDPGDRRDQAEQADEPEPDDRRERDVAAGDRRPDDAGEGDRRSGRSWSGRRRGRAARPAGR